MKIETATKKDVTAEILQGFDFYSPVFDHFGQLCQAKNFFFWVMTHMFDNFL